jgi:zinc transport system ATP-binding protein
MNDARGGHALVRMSAIAKSFGREQVLSNVDLDIHEAEIVTLIGPNGSGKTTLVRIALGLAAPTRGQVRRAPAMRIGYVPQQVHVDTTLPLTVRRFLILGRSASQAQVQQVLDEVGAGELTDAAVQQLSGGEMRRVLLARALLQQPSLLVLDEPTAGVDVSGQAEIYGLIERLRRDRGCAVLLVSHDLHLVMATTDRVVCLNRHVCCEGTPEHVKVHPEYLTLFGPRLAARLAVYTHHHDHHHDMHGDVRDGGNAGGAAGSRHAEHG